MTLAEASWRDDAACRDAPTDWFFPDRDGPDNHGRQAKAVCAHCPVRTHCLTENLTAGYGIHGGAGEPRRRALRQAARVSPQRYEATIAAHFRALDGQPPHPTDHVLLGSHGDAATHGLRVTYAKGCRCPACVVATAIDGAAVKLNRRAAA